uniref:Ciliary microtubule inner protein 2B n=1 Tax=Geotrypetes seraphini TaxID=260995 RepID=A0A6P8PMG1_GEOSA|nr:protein FAM166B [Geotrypetes seraphini]
MPVQGGSKFTPTSPLLTPEPHYIPGYGGFCPQLKYHMGKSYGKLTSKLLTNPDIPHSPQLVLQNIHNPVPEEETAEPLTEMSKGWRRQWREELFTGSRIPGYTGFIPRSQHHFAKTYAQITQDALNDFLNQQNNLGYQAEELARLRSLQAANAQDDIENERKLLTAKYRTQLPPLVQGPPSYSAFRDDDSPYSMEDNNPHKYFMSGFTGYIPRARFLIGTGYPVTTNRALVEFGQKLQKKNKDSSMAYEAGKQHQSLPDIFSIYHSKLGLLPKYTGYIPGYKFKYGKTYGNLTRNVLGLSKAQKEVAASM